MLTCALMVQKSWWVKLLVPISRIQARGIECTSNCCIFHSCRTVSTGGGGGRQRETHEEIDKNRKWNLGMSLINLQNLLF